MYVKSKENTNFRLQLLHYYSVNYSLPVNINYQADNYYYAILYNMQMLPTMTSV